MPRKKKPLPTEAERAIWTELLDLGDRFREMAPWEWMSDQPVFAVREAPGAQTIYCSIVGGLGEVFGIVMFDGPEGWSSFERARQGVVDPLDAPYTQHALTLFHSDREWVGPEFRELLKALGRTPRGRGKWPEAQVHRPGLVPRVPSAEEAALMARVVAEALVTCERTRAARLPVDDSILVRCGGRDLWEKRPGISLAEAEVAPLDDLSLQRLRRIERRGGRWVGDHAVMPAKILEGPHPYFPRQGLWIDAGSTMILDMDLMAPGTEPEARLRARLLDLMAKHGAPDAIVVRRESTARALAPLRDALNVKIEVDPEPRMLLDLIGLLHDSMMQGG